ncbi:Gfo/Idh/MocA family protein [Oceanobacillus halophilus]|uniref:Gfo/Idh/MocA family oxidoreductase n=1 Tax=Oceanobacillus halophilus TaxID=930130 RepID=A0A495A0W4_9BACI|nr:Gfo/Idh/MocA family oxidoreductase [Oceanobacillus halophilus]RKQ32472.1 gfo/Idh/MocA family oxidoreductase [Oceanobacillus halophilus]
MTKVKWGILSTANIAQEALLPAFTRSTNAEVIAIASNNVQKAKGIADRFQINKVYDSYEKLLEDPDIQAVYIPLPNHLHKEWVMRAAEKGKHILCEKPAGLDYTEVKEMLTACRAMNVLFMEAFMYQFHPQHQRVKDIIASGEIGEVTLMNSAFSYFLTNKEENIRMSQEKGGGSLYDVGCYPIHAICNIFGEEPEEVFAQAIIDETYKVDTDVVAQLTFPSGKMAKLDASFRLTFRNEYEVIGSKGKMMISNAFRPDVEGGDGLVKVETEDGIREEVINGDIYRGEIEHFSEAIQMQKEVHQLQQTPEQTINTAKIIDACFESMKTGHKVRLDTI